MSVFLSATSTMYVEQLQTLNFVKCLLNKYDMQAYAYFLSVLHINSSKLLKFKTS